MGRMHRGLSHFPRGMISCHMKVNMRAHVNTPVTFTSLSACEFEKLEDETTGE